MSRRFLAYFCSLIAFCVLVNILGLPGDSVRGQGVATPTAAITATPSGHATGGGRLTTDNAAQIKEVGRLGNGQADTLEWSPDGKTLAAAGSIGVWLYDTSTFDSAPKLLKSTHWCSVIAFSPDSTKLAMSCEGNTIHLVDVKTGQRIFELRGHTDKIHTLVFNSDGSMIASGSDDRSVRLWDTRSGKQQGILIPQSPSQVYSLAFSPDNALLAASQNDGALMIWSMNRAVVQAFRNDGHDAASTIRFAPDGKTVFYGNEDFLAAWNMKPSSTPIFYSLGTEYYYYDVPLAISADATSAAFQTEPAVIVIDIKTKKTLATLATLEEPMSRLRSIVFSPDASQVAAVGDSNLVRIWKVKDSALLATLVHTEPLTDVAFRANGDQVVAGSIEFTTCGTCDRDVRFIWEMKSRQLVKTLRSGHQAEFWQTWFNADATFALGEMEQQLAVQDVQNGKDPVILKGSDRRVDRFVFSQDNALVAVNDYGKVIVWDTRTGSPVSGMVGDTWGWNLAFSPDDKVLASDTSSFGLVFWNAATGEKIAANTDSRGEVYAMAFSPDGTLLATGSDGNIAVWDSKTARLRFELDGQGGTIRGLAFNPDGTLLATASNDSTIRLWSVTTHRLLIQLTGHAAGVGAVAFNPSGSLLASVSIDGTLRLWGLS